MQFYVQFTQCNDKIITEKIAVPYGNFSIKSKLDARYYNDIPIRTIETDSLGQAKVSLISGTYGVFNEIKLNQAFIKSYLYRLKEIKDPHRKFDESCFKKYTTTPDQVIVVNGNKHFDIIMELPCDSPHYPCFVPKK
jgi:hypothetical protein